MKKEKQLKVGKWNVNLRYFLFTLFGILFIVAGSVWANTVISDVESSFGGDVLVGGTNISDGVLTITRNTASETGINLRSNGSEDSVRILFWDHPTSNEANKRIAQIVAHGNATGSDENELAFYTVNKTGTVVNVFKLLSGENMPSNSAPLILTSASGIARQNTNIINIGESVNGNGVQPVRLHDDLDLNNSDINNVGAINMEATSISNSAGISGRNTGSLNFVGGTSSQDIKFIARNSADSQVTRLILNGGDDFGSSVQVGDGVNQHNITMTSPDGTEFSCGVNNSGTFSCT